VKLTEERSNVIKPWPRVNYSRAAAFITDWSRRIMLGQCKPVSRYRIVHRQLLRTSDVTVTELQRLDTERRIERSCMYASVIYADKRQIVKQVGMAWRWYVSSVKLFWNQLIGLVNFFRIGLLPQRRISTDFSSAVLKWFQTWFLGGFRLS